MSENQDNKSLMKAYKACSYSFSQKEKYLDIYNRLLEKEKQQEVKEPVSDPKVEEKEESPVSEAKLEYKQIKSQNDLIQFSCNLAFAFETLMKSFNAKVKGKRVQLAYIRNTFIEAARHFEKVEIKDKKKTHFCLACVNLYLREKIEGKESDLSEFDYKRALEQITDFGLSYDFASVNDLYITHD